MTTYALKNKIESVDYRQKAIFWALFLIVVFMLSSYGFLVIKSITNGINKDTMQKKIITLNSDVNSLEFQYLNIKNNITLSFAESHGFVAVSNEKFVALSSDAKSSSLSVNKNQ